MDAHAKPDPRTTPIVALAWSEGIAIGDVLNRAGVAWSTWKRWERGESVPQADKLQRVSDALDTLVLERTPADDQVTTPAE